MFECVFANIRRDDGDEGDVKFVPCSSEEERMKSFDLQSIEKETALPRAHKHTMKMMCFCLCLFTNIVQAMTNGWFLREGVKCTQHTKNSC